LNVNLEPRKTG